MAKIRLAPTAVSDLHEIKDYISEKLCNPIAAKRVVNKIIDDYTMFETSPFMGVPLSSKVPFETVGERIVVKTPAYTLNPVILFLDRC